MEVIFKGQNPNDKWYAGTCSTCKTQVRFQQHEASLSGDYRDRGSSYHVKCPVCSSFIYGTVDTKQTASTSLQPTET